MSQYKLFTLAVLLGCVLGNSLSASDEVEDTHGKRQRVAQPDQETRTDAATAVPSLSSVPRTAGESNSEPHTEAAVVTSPLRFLKTFRAVVLTRPSSTSEDLLVRLASTMNGSKKDLLRHAVGYLSEKDKVGLASVDVRRFWCMDEYYTNPSARTSLLAAIHETYKTAPDHTGSPAVDFLTSISRNELKSLAHGKTTRVFLKKGEDGKEEDVLKEQNITPPPAFLSDASSALVPHWLPRSIMFVQACERNIGPLLGGSRTRHTNLTIDGEHNVLTATGLKNVNTLWQESLDDPHSVVTVKRSRGVNMGGLPIFGWTVYTPFYELFMTFMVARAS